MIGLPSANAYVPLWCEFEDFFAVSDPPSASRQNLTVYPRVAEIFNSSAEKASRLARESRPLHRVVPFRRKMFFVGDHPDFCNARFVNPDFARISKHKNILKTRTSSVNLADLERIERGSRTILAVHRYSHSLRMTDIIHQIRRSLIRIFLHFPLLLLRRP